MKSIYLIIQIISAILLTGTILIQARGTGFGRGSTASFTRRGLEKLIFRLTFVFAAIFMLVSILQVTL